MDWICSPSATATPTGLQEDQTKTSPSSSSSSYRPKMMRSQPNSMLSAFILQKDALYAEMEQASHQGLGGHNHHHFSLSDVFTKSTTTNSNSNESTYKNLNSFETLWNAELKRVEDFLQAQQQHVEYSAKALVGHVEGAITKPKPQTSLQDLRRQADAIVTWALQLHQFATDHRQTLMDIARKADRVFSTRSNDTHLKLYSQDLQQRLENGCWSPDAAPQASLVVALSDVYQLLRDAETASSASTQEWVAPEEFERRTTKFWVHKEHLTDLLLHAVQEAPLLVYGRTGRLTSKSDCLYQHNDKYQQNAKDKLWDELATPISSVYFDNEQHYLYKERLARHEGAQLLRVRWYGHKRPQGTEHIFLELKTHHEKWINTKSLKERCILQAQDVKAVIKLDGKQWTPKQAQELLLKANPDMEQAKVDKQIDLLLRMRQLVLKHNLKPCVRSVYLRAAFQSSTSNALRFTVDRKVTVVDESSNNNNHDDDWCLPDNAVLQPTGIKQVPYVVLEVKLAEEDCRQNNNSPDLIQDLQNRGVIIEAAKFSKFLTGAAVFDPQGVNMLPYWAEHPSFRPLFGLEKHGNFLNSTKNNQQVTFSQVDTVQTVSDSRDKAKESGNHDNRKNNLDSDASVNLHPDIIVRSAVEFKQAESCADLFEHRCKDSNKNEKTSKPTSFLSRDLLGGVLFRRGNKKKEDSDSEGSVTATTTPVIAPRRPARVEPKSYFANERTFIQWISAGLLLVTISVILLGIDSSMGSTSTFARKSGVGVCGGAVLIVFYATFVYFRRLRLLATGNPYGYVDNIGPVVLAIAVSVGVIVLLTHFIGQIEFSRAQDIKMVYLHDQPGQCFMHSNRGISKLEYQPSDIAVDSKRNILLVPTLQRIVAHPLTEPLPNRENRVETLVEIPNSNLEGITLVDDRVFALSEGPSKTELIELFWNGNEKLEVVNRWKLGTSAEAEGMAYVPDKTRRSGRLFIDVNYQIQIYNLPAAQSATSAADDDERNSYSLVLDTSQEVSTELDRIGSLNSHVLKNGLTDMRISSMYYFEGVAYILHDNEMVIRAWDLDEGDLLAEIPVPRIVGNFTDEWEGLALERRPISRNGETGLLISNPSLRGTTQQQQSPSWENGDSQLILHMALDTPAQVWSMVVKQTERRGELVLPSCAVNNAQNHNLHSAVSAPSEDLTVGWSSSNNAQSSRFRSP